MAQSKQFTVFTKFAVKNQFTGPALKIAKSADVIGQRLEGAKKIAGKVGSGIAAGGKAMLGVIGGATTAAAAVFALAKVSSDAADDILNTANAIGISTDALQEYRYIGVQAGLTTEEMDAAMTKMTVNLGKNFEEVDAALYQVGLSAEGLKAAGPDKALEYIAQGFKDVKDPAKKAAVATALFGKSSVRMVNALSGGQDAIKGLRKEAQDTGYVMSEGMVKNAGEMDDALDKLGATAKGLAYRMGAGLVPQMTKVIDRLQSAIKPGGSLGGIFNSLAGFGGDIFGKVFDFFEKVGPSLGRIIDSVFKVAKPLLDLLDPILKIMAGLMPVIERVVGAVATVLEPILGLLKTVLDAVASLFDHSPGAFETRAGGTAPATFGQVGGGVPRASAGYGAPVSPQTTPLSSSTTSTSQVGVTFNNPPPGTVIKQDKPAPGITLNTGGAHPAGVTRFGTRKP